MKRLCICLIVALLAGLALAQEAIDWNKARQLHQRASRGEKLAPEEQAYYEKAKAARGKGAPGKSSGKREPDPNVKPSTGLIPLTDMTADQKYKGEEGGIYGGGSNAPPDTHLKAALAQAEKIQPLDAAGKPAADGKVVMISIGMSNTTQEFSGWARQINSSPDRPANLLIIDGAQGGQALAQWVNTETSRKGDPWKVLDQRIQSAGVMAPQIQVAWIKQAHISPSQYGEFPKHAQVYKNDLQKLVTMLKSKFPNLRLAYLSSRIYAGFASTQLNPEPYAYEGAFGTRWLIQDQIKGEPALSCGDGKAPLLLWGPYLWADGMKGRKFDDLKYEAGDYAGDGTHPGDPARAKVMAQLTRFFTTDPTATPWFSKH